MEKRMDWLSTLVGETRMRLLRLVRGASRSVGELAPALGISENAVRGHIAAAERDGLVRQTAYPRPSGGKPARLYELTPEAEELFPKAYAVAFSELVRMLRDEDGDEAAIERLRRVGRRLGARAASAGGSAALAGASIASRVAMAAAVLESSGGSVEVFEDAEGWTLRSDSCPLSGVVTRDPDVCALAESLVAEVTGSPVVETCRRNGRPRCAFQIAR
jgi:predicted ArsR family transcriptional regulator